VSTEHGITVDLSDPEVSIDGRRFSQRWTSGDAVWDLECDPVSSTASLPLGCAGNADSCSLYNCDSQAGCSYDIGFADDPSDDRCRGAAYACKGFLEQDECERQSGCAWG